MLGVPVAAPTAPLGPLPAGTPLVNVPWRIPVFLDQTTLQATLALPLSDYPFFGIAPTHAAESVGRRTQPASRAQAARRQTILGAKVALLRMGTRTAVASGRGGRAGARCARPVWRTRDGPSWRARPARADLLRLGAQEADAEQAVVGAGTLATALESRLRTNTCTSTAARGWRSGKLYDEDVALPDESRDLERLTAEAEASRPEMRALDARISAMTSQARAAGASEAPVLAVYGEVTDADPNPRYLPSPDAFATTWSVTAQLTWSPSDAASSFEARRRVGERARPRRRPSAGRSPRRAALGDRARPAGRRRRHEPPANRGPGGRWRPRICIACGAPCFRTGAPRASS